MTNISVIGLGKLGACMAACFASKGHNVIGVDVNAKFIEAVNAGRAPVVEPRLDETIKAGASRLRATSDYKDAILNSDVTFIIVPTPSQADGSFSLKFAMESAKSIGQMLRQKSSYHLVVLSSTVLPGSTENALKSVLEQESGKTCGKDFGLAYSPEFIALGSVIRDFLNPDFALIGEYDARAGDILVEIYKTTFENDPPMARMNIVNAELTKIALNTYVTTKITFANMLAETCERLPGADADVVAKALGMDTRIGAKYLRGGLGYGGPCFPRDNVAFSCLLDHLGVPSELPRAVDNQNHRQAKRTAEKAIALAGPAKTVGVLGLSYKPETPVVEASQGVAIAKALAAAGKDVLVYDPLSMPDAKKVLGESVRYANTAEEVVAASGAVVLATAWPQFKTLKLDETKLVDSWRVVRPSTARDGYVGLGLGTNTKEDQARVVEFVQRIVSAGNRA